MSPRADVDPQLDVVVMRALESMPDARQPKMSKLQRELEGTVGRARVIAVGERAVGVVALGAVAREIGRAMSQP
jgi:hypothetical protein